MQYIIYNIYIYIYIYIYVSCARAERDHPELLGSLHALLCGASLPSPDGPAARGYAARSDRSATTITTVVRASPVGDPHPARARQGLSLFLRLAALSRWKG